VVTTGTQTFAGDKSFSGRIGVGGAGVSGAGGPLNLPIYTWLSWGSNNVLTGESGLLRVAGNVVADTYLGLGGNPADVLWVRDAADTMAQRRGTVAQIHRVYNTYTNSTSFERLNIAWASNVCTINTTAGSTLGSVRQLVVGCGTTGARAFFSSGRFDVATAGSWTIGNGVSASAYSTFAIGDNSLANTQQSFCIGFYASTYSTTQFSRTTIARPWTAGSAQTSEFRAFAQSGGTSPFEFVWNGNAVNRWIIPNNRVWSCILRIVGVDTTAANQSVVTFDRKFCIARLGNSGTVAIHGGVQVIGTDVDNVGGAAISIAADDTNKCANIQITAPNANTWYWYGTLYVEDIIRT